MLRHHIEALLSPFGRLNQVGFAILAIALAFGHIFVYGALKQHPDLPPWNVFTIALFVMLWMTFCILRRRMHDTGSNGYVLVPVLVVTAVLYLISIDPKGIGATSTEVGVVKFLVSNCLGIARALLIGAFAYCIRTKGQSGPNRYGPEFGEGPEGCRYEESLEAAVASFTAEPQPTYGARPRDNDPARGKRQQTKSFGRR